MGCVLALKVFPHFTEWKNNFFIYRIEHLSLRASNLYFKYMYSIAEFWSSIQIGSHKYSVSFLTVRISIIRELYFVPTCILHEFSYTLLLVIFTTSHNFLMPEIGKKFQPPPKIQNLKGQIVLKNLTFHFGCYYDNLI